jgi:uncharacterized damage-inducible protein DinB
MDHRLVLAHVDRDLALYLDKIRTCVALLDEDEVWRRTGAATNSVGNLLLHLAGNLSQWVLEGIGGRPYARQRTREFTSERTASRDTLVARLSEVVGDCRRVIAGLSEDDLAAPRTIQKYSTDGLHAVLHVWEHMSYHTGQIVLLAKQMAGDRTTIDFYPQHRGE